MSKWFINITIDTNSFPLVAQFRVVTYRTGDSRIHALPATFPRANARVW
jgi:hypothetical protein